MCREVSVSNLACCRCMIRAVKRLEQLARGGMERPEKEREQIPLDESEKLPDFGRLRPKGS